MNLNELKNIIIDHQKLLESYPLGIERDLLKEIGLSRNDRKVYVITGIRRCGKSTLLRQIAQGKEYIYLDFTDERLSELKPNEYNLILEASYYLGYKNPLFIFDEVQLTNNFNRFLNRLATMNYKVFISGSNATLLGREINTFLTGRHIDFCLYPFSFSEYLRFKGIREELYGTENIAKIKRAFEDYYLKGGFPEIARDDRLIYANTYFDDILYKDILKRWMIKNVRELKEIFLYLIKNIGNNFTYRALAKEVGGLDVSTVKNYVEFGETAYLFFIVEEYTNSPKESKYPKKVYVYDPAFSFFYKSPDELDRGHFLENIVAIELKRRKYEFKVFRGKRECDFVVIDHTRKVRKAIQVTYELNTKNRDREIEGLLEAMERFKLKEGLLLTYDQEDEIKFGKKIIHIKPVWKWLLEKSD